MRGIQYAAAFRFYLGVSGIRDRPTAEGAALALFKFNFQTAKTVIASVSEAIQLSFFARRKLDCFVAEPVIGRAFARPGGSSQ
jgi:hypothetical protein